MFVVSAYNVGKEYRRDFVTADEKSALVDYDLLFHKKAFSLLKWSSEIAVGDKKDEFKGKRREHTNYRDKTVDMFVEYGKELARVEDGIDPAPAI